MLRSIPLGLHQLWHQKLRMLAATLGITFAVILIFVQLGFRKALFDSAGVIPDPAVIATALLAATGSGSIVNSPTGAITSRVSPALRSVVA